MVLRFEEGRSFEEIGRLTGRSPDAVRKVLTRYPYTDPGSIGGPLDGHLPPRGG